MLVSLPQPAADVAVRELVRIIEELRAAGLEYQRRKALALRRAVLGTCVLDGSDPG